MKVDEFLGKVTEAMELERPITTEDTIESVVEWDSMGHLTILSTIDNEFGIDTQVDELTDAQSMGEIVQYLKAQDLLED